MTRSNTLKYWWQTGSRNLEVTPRSGTVDTKRKQVCERERRITWQQRVARKRRLKEQNTWQREVNGHQGQRQPHSFSCSVKTRVVGTVVGNFGGGKVFEEEEALRAIICSRTVLK